MDLDQTLLGRQPEYILCGNSLRLRNHFHEVLHLTTTGSEIFTESICAILQNVGHLVCLDTISFRSASKGLISLSRKT
ncbi:hypothetical protein APX01_07965 [Cereibacter sphaeroides]|nr:hypothetical protein APX01_07965 [Cereibacter sphaeroides]ANS34181.1 hypothetical protein A3858_07990 [Cereibacter sphaeroides]ATN63226.1 hypothetical protein A3857_07985 [Cereibacter sphaeroides]